MERKETNWHSIEMLLLQQIMQNIGKNHAPDAAIKTMLHLMSELVGLNRGRIVLADADTRSLAIRYAYGLTAAQIRNGRYRPGEGITGAVFANQHTLIVQDVHADKLFLGRSVSRRDLPQEKVSFIALPLMAGARCLGVLACHRLRMSERAMHDDLALLKILTTLAAQLLHWHADTEAHTAMLQNQNRQLSSYSYSSDFSLLWASLRQQSFEFYCVYRATYV